MYTLLIIIVERPEPLESSWINMKRIIIRIRKKWALSKKKKNSDYPEVDLRH